jgi:hypothetical protein
MLNAAPRRADVVFYIPFEKWPTLSDAELINCISIFQNQNIQFVAACEDTVADYAKLKPTPIVFALGTSNDPHLDSFRAHHGLIYSNHDDKNWIGDIQRVLQNSLKFDGPKSVRAVVRDQPKRTIVHLLNLNVQRVSSYEDKVTPATGISIQVRVPNKHVRSVQALTVDTYATRGKVEFTSQKDPNGSLISFDVPNLGISTIVVIE